MRVLVVCRSFPAHRAGGMESHAAAVVEGLVAAGHRVSVVTTGLPRRAAVAPLRTNGLVVTLGGSSGEGRYSLGFLGGLALAVRRVVARERIDIIHAQGFAGVVLALASWLGRALGAPLVTTIHGTHWSETSLDRRSWRRLGVGARLGALWRYKARVATWPLWWLFLRSQPRLIVDSDFTRAELRRESPRLPEPVVVALGFADESLVEAVPPEAPPTLLALGRLEVIKGFDTVVAAAGLLDGNAAWRLLVVGAGPDEERLRRIARTTRVGDRIVFAGRLDEEAKHRALAGAAVVLVPDRGQPAFGLAVAEALCAGVPVLASRVGAHGEVLTDPRDGELVAADTPSWARAMAMWLERSTGEGPEVRAQRAERARRRFARSRMIAELVRVYERMTMGRRTPQGR